ncbi:MAG: response regulator [Anaerolineales bacterium]
MADTMKVLLLAIYPRVQQKLRDLLRQIPGVSIPDMNINNAEEAIDAVFHIKPDVVLLENDFPGMDGYYLAELIHKESPLTQVIVVSEVSSAESVRMAMRAGACDYLNYKTLTAEELSAALSHAQSIIQEERTKRRAYGILDEEEKTPAKPTPTRRQRARIVTFYSPKGGAGTSTILVNMAQALHDKGMKVLAVDASLQYGDIALLFNQFSNRTIANLANKIDDIDEQLVLDIVGKAGPDILAAPNDPAQAVQVTGPTFSKIINFVANMDYDIILINTSSYINDATFVALDVAEIIVLLVVQEIAAVRAARSFLSLMSELGLQVNRTEIVLNRYDPDAILTTAKISESLGRRVGFTLKSDYEMASRAANLGVPFMMEYKNYELSKQIIALGDYLVRRLAEIEPHQPELQQG